MILDNSLDECQPHTGADHLGSKKRVKYLSQVFFRDADSGVRHLHDEISLFLVVEGRDGQFATVGHRIGSVHAQVVYYRFHLVHVEVRDGDALAICAARHNVY